MSSSFKCYGVELTPPRKNNEEHPSYFFPFFAFDLGFFAFLAGFFFAAFDLACFLKSSAVGASIGSMCSNGRTVVFGSGSGVGAVDSIEGTNGSDVVCDCVVSCFLPNRFLKNDPIPISYFMNVNIFKPFDL